MRKLDDVEEAADAVHPVVPWFFSGLEIAQLILYGVATLVLILAWNRLVPRVPGYIVALLGSLAIVALTNLPVETIGTRFGGIPSGWPPFAVPRFRLDLVPVLLQPAITVAMLVPKIPTSSETLVP